MANREYEDNLLETGNSLTEIMKQLRVPEQDLDEFTKQIDDLLNAPFSSDVEIKEISRRIDHMTRLTNEMIHLNKEAQTDRQRNIESTSKSIQCHKEDLRVPTAAAERGREILDRESVLIFTGVSGQGKTWHCLEVLSEVQKECDDIIHLDNTKLDLDTWNRLVGTSSTGVLWIDNLSTISIETQKVFFEKLIKQLDKNKGNMKVVISINSEKAKERQSENVKSEWKYFCLFQDRFNVDLDKESMNYDERCAILTGFVKMGQDTSRSNIIHKFLKINIISDSENESFAEEPYAIRQSTIEEISKTFENPNFGFPECCRQFCSNKKLFSFGKRFFEDPYERTSTVLQDMMKSSDCNEKTKFCILCVLLFHDRPCAIDRIISNSFRIKSFMSLNENEIDSKTIKTISSTFIEITHRNEIKFKHDSIRKAVARTFCKYDNSCLEHFVLKGPFDLILNQCTSSLHKESSHQSQQVLVESETFITRLLNELKMNNFRRTIILVSKIIRTNPNIGVEIEKRDVPMSKRMKAALVVNSLSPLDRINYAVEESSGSFWYIYFKDIAGQSEKVVRVIRMKDLYLCQMSIDLRNQAITGRQWSEEETGNCDSDGIIVGALQSMSNDTKILEILESDNTVNIVFDKYFKQFGKTHFIVSDNSYLPDLNNNCRNCSRSTLSIGNYDISNLDSAVLITNEILFYQFTALKFMHIIQRHDLSLISLCEIHLSELYIFDSKLKNELSFHMSIEWINQTRIDVIQMLIDENKPTTETIRDLFLMSCRRGCHLIVELLLNEENNPMNVDNLSIGKGIQIACEAGHSMVVDSVLKWRNDIVSHDILAESLAKAKENDHFQAYFFILTSQQVHSYLEGNFNTTDSLYTEIVETIRTCSCRVLETVFATYIDKKNHIGIKMIYDRRPSACESEM